ncbi:MAG: flagellar biosynthetic protein FliR [Acidobacteriia bacterium]|nr:flagellar biosynthetic protein FliR [Terriglobia bacterium]
MFQMPIALEPTIAVWMIAGSRVTGLLMVAPFLGSAAVPARIKAGLAFLLTLFLVPQVPSLPALPTPALIVLLLGEFTIGLLLGFTLQLFFEAGQLAGQVCGVQMGYSLASIINPDSQADSPVLSTFYELIVLLLFIQLSVPHWLLRGLARSFAYLPPGNLSLTWPAVHALLEFTAGMFVAGLQIAAPVLVASLFADIALGFVGKASPQLPVLFVGISIKNLLGLALFCGAIAFWPRFFDARFGHALEASERILKLAH